MAFNIQQRDREVFLQAFKPGASWARLSEDRELMRGWRVLDEAKGRVVLAHGSGAVGVVERAGDKITEVEVREEGEARELLSEHGFRPSKEIADRAKRSLRPGREVEEAIDETFPRRLGLVELGEIDGQRLVRVGAHGVLALSVDERGQLRAYRWRTGADAIELIEGQLEAAAWEVPKWPETDLPARTPEEAELFVQVRKGSTLDSREVDGRWEIRANTPEGQRLFTFRLGSPRAEGLGDGASKILDPFELVLFASRVEEELPQAPTPERIAYYAARHRLAAAGLRQAERFIPEGRQHPPAEAISSKLGRRQLAATPDRFSRQGLLTKAEELDAMARLLSEELTAPEPLQARCGREARWWLRSQGAPVDLIVDEPGGGWSVQGPGASARRFALTLDPKGPAALEPRALLAVVGRTLRALPAADAPLSPALLDHRVSELEEALACLEAALAAGAPAPDGEPDALRAQLQAAQKAAGEAIREPVEAPPALTPIGQRRLLREFTEGRPVLEAAQACADRAPMRLQSLAQLNLPDGRKHRFFVVSELAEGGPRVGVLATVNDADDGVLGRQVLVGAEAARQRDLLAEALGGLSVAAPQQQAREAVRALQELLRPTLRAAGDGDVEAFEGLLPRPGDAEKAFTAEVAPKVAAAMSRWLESDEPPSIQAKPGQTALTIDAAPVEALASEHPLSRPFAGAWTTLAKSALSPGRTWVTWVYHVPGEPRGMRYDGLVWLDDHWAWFPKPWRALK